MDFTQAALLIGGVFALTELYKRIYPASPPALTQAVVFVIGIATTFLAAYSTYAKDITVGGHTLDNVNTAGLIFIGALIGGGGATVLHQGYGAVKNVGQNFLGSGSPPPDPQ